MVQSLAELLANPIFWKVIVAYWLYSALVGALPSPSVVSQYVKSGIGLLIYSFVFGFLHIFAGSLNRAAISFKVPGAGASSDAPSNP